MEMCSKYVDHGGGIGFFCRKEPIRLIDGKYYCKLHEPDRVRARDKRRDDKYDAAHEEWQERHARDMLILGLFGGISGRVIKGNEDNIREYLKSLVVEL